MIKLPIFLSVVLVIKNQESKIETILRAATTLISECANDYELIVIDNASGDNSIRVLKNLTDTKGLPNLQVYALVKPVGFDTASWAGLENALGDFVAVIDPLVDDLKYLPQMLDKSVNGSDVVFANNTQKPRQNLAYRAAYGVFLMIYKYFNELHREKEFPSYRILSKRVINYILQHPQPHIAYRHLPAASGFMRSNLTYSSAPAETRPKKIADSINTGMRLLVSTTRGPMRLVTTLSLFGALANVLYSLYVVLIYIFKADVAPGWFTMSLQQSGMFFLISLVLLVLGEYILHMTSLQNEGPIYHIGQEFSSARMTRKEKLNVENESGSNL